MVGSGWTSWFGMTAGSWWRDFHRSAPRLFASQRPATRRFAPLRFTPQRIATHRNAHRRHE